MDQKKHQTRTAIGLAIVSGLLLAAFLWLRPVIGDLGKPTAPNTSGRATRVVPDGVTSGAGNTETGAPPVSTTGGKPDLSGISHLEELEKLILNLTNEERAKQKLAPLQAEDTLRDTARDQSDDMIARGFFDHVNPDGLAPADRIAIRHRRLIGLTGENIWKSSGLSPADLGRVAHEIMYGEGGWMNSPGHRANILRPDYNSLGVGISVRGDEIRASQNFAAVHALMNRPLPADTRNGEVLDLSSSAASATPAERYDYWLPSKGVNTGASYPIGDGTVKVNAGSYKLRFYFPSAEGYNIYEGPRIDVR